MAQRDSGDKPAEINLRRRVKITAEKVNCCYFVKNCFYRSWLQRTCAGVPVGDVTVYQGSYQSGSGRGIQLCATNRIHLGGLHH